MDAFTGEIRPVAFNYAPHNWAICDGSLLSVNDYSDLYTLLGTTYGGNGTTTFALPDLRGRVPMHKGTGQGLTPRFQGQAFGTETVTLTTSNLPQHHHDLKATTTQGTQTSPQNNIPAAVTYSNYYNADPGTFVKMDEQSVSAVGGSLSHNNLMPYMTINFIICVHGIYPSRN
ncbi:MAG: phage tail protein [Candidatus Delongbacteria bacterium]|nr:phage tail protein [Candidatus Delongbacteria bacterium]